jgi:hypothetical protein
VNSSHVFAFTRYLQKHPTQASGVVLESVCLTDCDSSTYDRDIDATAHQLFDACGRGACSSNLGPIRTRS